MRGEGLEDCVRPAGVDESNRRYYHALFHGKLLKSGKLAGLPGGEMGRLRKRMRLNLPCSNSRWLNVQAVKVLPVPVAIWMSARGLSAANERARRSSFPPSSASIRF